MSLCQQDFSSYEIIVHDDCSSDNTCQVVTDFLQSLSSTTAQSISVYRSRTNCGILINRLRGFFRAKGEWFVMTDGDDISVDGRLSLLSDVIHSLNHSPMLIATNRYVFMDGTPYSEVPNRATKATNLKEGWVTLEDIVWQSNIPSGSSGFVVNRSLFEKFQGCLPDERIIADDPVLARRALLVGDIFVTEVPMYYCRISNKSASGAGVSGKEWIIDRINRWNLLIKDIKHVSPTHSISEKVLKDIEYWKKRMALDARLIDCSSWVWPFLWVRMVFISPLEAKYALKKRAKLILYGNVNASRRK